MKHIFKGLNHATDRFVGVRSLRAFVAMMTIAILAALPYADANATVNPNNFSISFGLSDTSDPDYSIGTQYYCMPRYNDSSGTYAQTAMDKILNNDGTTNDAAPSRKAAITRKHKDGNTGWSYFFYNLYNTTTVGVTYTNLFGGYWFTRNSDHKVRFRELHGKALHKGYWYFGAVNDEYGNLLFASATYDTSNSNTNYRKDNYFPNHLHPIMADGLQKGKVGEDLTASAPMEPQKTIQVWGQTQEYYQREYPKTYTGSSSVKGACQVLQASGDIGTYTDQDAISAGRYGKGGYVWYTPQGLTDRIFRVKIGYSATENDNVGYKGVGYILFDGKLSIGATRGSYSSCIGYGDNDDRMMVHDYGTTIYLCKYSNGVVTYARGFSNGNGVSNNARFVYGAPTVFSLQGHNYLVTADDPYGQYGYGSATATDAGSGGMKIYEILEDASGVIYLNQVYAKNPMTSGDHGTGTKYTKCNSNIHGPAFSTLRHSAFQHMIFGMAYRTGYYTYAVFADALPTTACSYIPTYKQNGTSTPTLRRIIYCNPPTGGEALSYSVFNASNTDITSGLINVDSRTYIDDNSTRCSSSSTCSYYTKGVYECDGHARTTTSTTSPAGPSSSAASIPAPTTNSGFTSLTLNYFDSAKNPKGYYEYSRSSITGTAGGFKNYSLSINGASSTSINESGTNNGFLSSFSATPVYSIVGHNNSAVAVSWDYYGTGYSSSSVAGVDSDCPKPTTSLSGSLQTTSSEVTQMNLPVTWTTPAASSKAVRNSYEVVVVDNATGNEVYRDNAVSSSLTSVTVPDVQIGHSYTAYVRANYSFRNASGYYSDVTSYSTTPDYTADAPQVNVTVKEAPNGTVAIWDEDHGWHNVTTPDRKSVV